MTAEAPATTNTVTCEPRQRRYPPARGHVRCAVGTVSLAVALSHLTTAEPLSAQALLKPVTIRAFDAYAQHAEQQFSSRLAGESPFLWSSEASDRLDEILNGTVLVQPSSDTGWHELEGGLVHDWTAAVLVPGTTVEQVVGVVTAYDTHAITYAPSVMRSQVLRRLNGKFRVAMRILARNVMTAVLDTEHVAEYAALDDSRWWGRSRSVSIREVIRPGSPEESLRPVGEDNGFLWRLHVYWRFAQTERGVVAEHRAISLTRNLPKALRWMLRPMLGGLPSRSLKDMMRGTREAALATAQ